MSELVLLRRVFHNAREAVEEGTRRVRFVAATEDPVATWWGPEVLRMSGLDPRDYQANPVVLDSHRQGSALDVIGQAVEVAVRSRKLHLAVDFDEDERSDLIFQKVKRGSVRALSVGYVVDRKKVRELREGETDGEGAALVKGPALIVNKWRLLEVSVVSVPADPNALCKERNVFYGAGREGQPLRLISEEDPVTLQFGSLPGIGSGAAPAAPAPAATPVPDAGQQTRAAAAAGAAPSSLPSSPSQTDLDAAARASAAEESRARAIRALAPEDLRAFADDLVLKGLSVEKAREELLAERAKRSQPVGTPPAPPQASTTPKPNAAPAMEARSFASALTGR